MFFKSYTFCICEYDKNEQIEQMNKFSLFQFLPSQFKAISRCNQTCCLVNEIIPAGHGD